MDAQGICIHSGTGRVGKSNVDATPPMLYALLGTLLNLQVQFIDDSHSTIELAAGTTGRLTIKQKGVPEGTALLLDADWTLTGDGASAIYTFSLLADSEELRAAIAELVHLDCSAQITWEVDGEDNPRKSFHLDLCVLNSYEQPDDGLPTTTLSNAWTWLKARLVQGSNVTLTIDESAKTITINGEEGASPTVSWSSLTGVPSTFAPSSHTHSWSQISSGAPVDNAALVSYVSSNAIAASRQVATQHSLQGGGDLSANRTLSLVGDTATPGLNKIYGTDASGNRGWQANASALYNKFCYFVDLDTGDDATALPGRAHLPYETAQAAFDAWVGSAEACGIFIFGAGDHGSITCPGDANLTGRIMSFFGRGNGISFLDGITFDPPDTPAATTDANGNLGTDGLDVWIESDGSINLGDIVLAGGAGGNVTSTGSTRQAGDGGDSGALRMRGVVCDSILSAGGSGGDGVSGAVDGGDGGDCGGISLTRCEVRGNVEQSAGSAGVATGAGSNGAAGALFEVWLLGSIVTGEVTCDLLEMRLSIVHTESANTVNSYGSAVNSNTAEPPFP